MTALEQSAKSLLDAANRGDLVGIEEALAARATAIAELAEAKPSAETTAGLAAALETGAIDCLRAMNLFKQRLGLEKSHVAQVQALVHDLLAPPDPQIDYRA